MPNVVEVRICSRPESLLDQIERAGRIESLVTSGAVHALAVRCESLPARIESSLAMFERVEAQTRAARMITSESVLAQTQRLERERRMLTEVRSPALIESPIVELERQQRMIDQYRRGESPLDHYERVMREQARIEELMRPTRPGLGVGPHPMSLADMELQNEYLEREIAFLLIKRILDE